ncbi:MAG: hypothetical protein ABFS46_15715 [Myxococcota bacterium]
MSRASPPQPLPTATELAHAPEIAILIALDTLLEMTTVTIHLALPELELLRRGRDLLDPNLDDRDLIVAQDILDLVGTLQHTLKIYRTLALRP